MVALANAAPMALLMPPDDTVRRAAARLEALASPSEDMFALRPRLSDVSQYTIDARTPQETAPASPRLSFPQPARREHGAQQWLPTGLQAHAPAGAIAFAVTDDPLNMSSKSYFKTYAQAQEPAPGSTSGPNAAVQGSFASGVLNTYTTSGGSMVSPGTPAPDAPTRREAAQRIPFPQARGTALKAKLNDASMEVAALRHSVDEAMAQPHMHLVQMQELLKCSVGIQDRTQLSDEELGSIGWPAAAFRQMRVILESLESWQQQAKAAQEQLDSSSKAVRGISQALERLLAAWCTLSVAVSGPVKVDLSMERRGWAASAMVSALIDAAVAQLKEQPDVPMVRQLELQLKRGAAQPELKDLGIEDLLVSTLSELAQCLQGLPPMSLQNTNHQAPELLWHSVTKGDFAAVVAIMQHGGLPSARVCDPQGHSVFWDAVAFHQADIALLLLQHFPPANSDVGVNLGEAHERTGNTLLHMAAKMQPFSQSAKQLFVELFESMPQALTAQRNFNGQTFLHMAAANMNFWLLRFALQHGLVGLISEKDDADWTPRGLLAHALAAKRVAEYPPVRGLPEADMAVSLPPWCRLGTFQPPKPGAAPQPFADCAVEVKDAKRGAMRIHAHRVILAGCSSVFRKELDALRPPSGELDNTAPSIGACRRPHEAPNLVHVDPSCCSNVDIVHHVLSYLYKADVSWCGSCDASDLMQALCFVHKYGFPRTLVVRLQDALLRSLSGEKSHALIPLIFKQAENLGFGGAAQLYLARRFICNDRGWDMTSEADACALLQTAFTKLEILFATGKSDGLIAVQCSQVPSADVGTASPEQAQQQAFAQQQQQQSLQQPLQQQRFLQQQWLRQWVQQRYWAHRQAGRDRV